jgi:hypothetical protein
MSKTTALAAPLQSILTDCSKSILLHTGHLEERIAALQAEVLPTQLKIGLHCLKAHMAFAHNPGRGGNKSGRNQHRKSGTVHVDGSSPQGFEGWLTANHPQIKKPTAYRWMTALKGLGLNDSDKEKQVDAELAKLTIPPSLKSLCAAALEAIGPPAPPPPNLQQSEFEFLKQGLTAFREETEHLLNMKDKLKENPDFHRAATARLYAALVELTGTNWAPSDEPDDLANVDPDAISI